MIPIIGLLFAVLVGEQISVIQISGGLIAIIGVIITQNILNFSKGLLHENPDSSH
jgi:drug/metabolite transporter (DMT)-like permease